MSHLPNQSYHENGDSSFDRRTGGWGVRAQEEAFGKDGHILLPTLDSQEIEFSIMV